MKWMSEDNLAYFWSKLKALLGGKKDVQSAKESPSTSGSDIAFIDTISQNANGEITATRKNVREASARQSGVVSTGTQTFAGWKTFNSVPTMPALELSFTTPYIDFHYANSDTDYDVRLITTSASDLNLRGGHFTVESGNVTVGSMSKTSATYNFVKAAAGQIYLYSDGSASGTRGLNTQSSNGNYQDVITVDQKNCTLFHGGLISDGTIGSGVSSHATALQNWFNSNKDKTMRNRLISFYSAANGNGSMCFGYFLNGYDNNPYGGFFVCHYNTPYYVGILNGTYTQQQILTDVSTKAAFSTIRTSNCGTTWCDGYYQKVGTLVTVCLGANNAVQLTTIDSVHIGTLPPGFRPTNRFFAAAATNYAGLGAQIHIDTDGKIYVTGKAGTIPARQEFYFCAAFHAK
jgi:hypothetical protein